MKQLILIDVFSYSCMNCIRSMQYIKKISSYYKKFGLKTIIVHPPEWQFEKNEKNILPILEKKNIIFPLVIDKNKKIIRRFGIGFWPSQLLIKDNKVVNKHIGEGNYKKLENYIRYYLDVNGKKLFKSEPIYSKYPAIYAGKNKGGIVRKIDNNLNFGKIFIKGKWFQKNEYIESKENNCMLEIITKGKIVNFVAKSSSSKPVKVKIWLNNKFIKTIGIKHPQLYQILSLKKPKTNKVSLIADKNLAVYSFSFR